MTWRTTLISKRTGREHREDGWRLIQDLIGRRAREHAVRQLLNDTIRQNMAALEAWNGGR